MVYRSVFNINFHHAYFLDEGEEIFSDMTDEAKRKSEPLKKYIFSDFLKIIPTVATQNIMKGYRLLIKQHPQGFRIIAKVVGESVSGEVKYSPLVTMPDDLTFTFGLYVTDPYFENYSELTNYEGNSLYLVSNVRPTTEAVDFASVFTSPANIDPDFLLTAESSRNLVHTIAREDVFYTTGVNRFSIANIDPADLDVVPGLELINQHIQSNKRGGLIGFVRLTIKGDSDNDLLEFDESDSSNVKQYVWDTPLEFTLGFKNRRTFWRYNVLSDDSTLTTDTTKPLVKNGFVQIEASDFNPEPTEGMHYPNPGIANVKKEDSNYYSELFI